MFPDLDEFESGAVFTAKDRILNRQQYNMEVKLSPDAIRYNIDENYQYMLARMTAYIYTESVGEYDHEWSYPATWWDHFKRDHFPKWLLDRYPVVYTTNKIRLHADAMFPEFKPPNGYGQTRYILREVNGIRKDAWGA